MHHANPPTAVEADITLLLRAWQGGDPEAFQNLIALIYPRLRGLAGRMLQKAGNRSLQPTEMVHEAFVELTRAGTVAWVDRGHFLAVAARAMHECFADHVARKSRQKRGGDQVRVTLESLSDTPGEAVDLPALHQAMDRLRLRDPRQFQVVACRYYAGLSVAETARVLGMSPRSVNLDWSMARAWLFGQLARQV